MFARNALRMAGQRAMRPAAFTPITARAAFNSSAKGSGPEVPVVSYHQGERTESAIPYEPKSGPVNPPGADEVKVAVPLKSEVFSQLTPTLSKFTLPGKVAIVTGYVATED